MNDINKIRLAHNWMYARK